MDRALNFRTSPHGAYESPHPRLTIPQTGCIIGTHKRLLRKNVKRRITGIERDEPSGTYDEKEWQTLQKTGGMSRLESIVAQGYEIGVPKGELDRFAEIILTEEIHKGNYDVVYYFRKTMRIGTEKDVRTVGAQAYESFLERRKFASAMSIAEDLYGRNSNEWSRAHSAYETVPTKKEKRHGAKSHVSLPQKATFFDLFIAIEDTGEIVDDHLMDGLRSGFDTETAEAVFELREKRQSETATIGVLEFFEKRGYSEEDVTTFLPITFKRERKKK
ncbi:MAG: hypothetical protein UW40_C0051G0006 [Parcubacteria group bacterium GW2011_GWF2_44_17]|nr:MAG: hypothetical protein UW40_C0051G0006 [Parcubacteria group bacterium GW2011_GWF2_44_17]